MAFAFLQMLAHATLIQTAGDVTLEGQIHVPGYTGPYFDCTYTKNVIANTHNVFALLYMFSFLIVYR